MNLDFVTTRRSLHGDVVDALLKRFFEKTSPSIIVKLAAHRTWSISFLGENGGFHSFQMGIKNKNRLWLASGHSAESQWLTFITKTMFAIKFSGNVSSESSNEKWAAEPAFGPTFEQYNKNLWGTSGMFADLMKYADPQILKMKANFEESGPLKSIKDKAGLSEKSGG